MTNSWRVTGQPAREGGPSQSGRPRRDARAHARWRGSAVRPRPESSANGPGGPGPPVCGDGLLTVGGHLVGVLGYGRGPRRPPEGFAGTRRSGEGAGQQGCGWCGRRWRSPWPGWRRRRAGGCADGRRWPTGRRRAHRERGPTGGEVGGEARPPCAASGAYTPDPPRTRRPVPGTPGGHAGSWRPRALSALGLGSVPGVVPHAPTRRGSGPTRPGLSLRPWPCHSVGKGALPRPPPGGGV